MKQLRFICLVILCLSELNGCFSYTERTGASFDRSISRVLYSKPVLHFSKAKQVSPALSSSHSSDSLFPKPSSPTYKHSDFPWLTLLGGGLMLAGGWGLLQPNSCSSFLQDGRCAYTLPPAPIWSILTVSGAMVSLIGWISWKNDQAHFSPSTKEDVP